MSNGRQGTDFPRPRLFVSNCPMPAGVSRDRRREGGNSSPRQFREFPREGGGGGGGRDPVLLEGGGWGVLRACPEGGEEGSSIYHLLTPPPPIQVLIFQDIFTCLTGPGGLRGKNEPSSR